MKTEKDKAIKRAIKLHKEGKSLREIGRITGLGAAQNVKHYITHYSDRSYSEVDLRKELKYLKTALYTTQKKLEYKENLINRLKEIILTA